MDQKNELRGRGSDLLFKLATDYLIHSSLFIVEGTGVGVIGPRETYYEPIGKFTSIFQRKYTPQISVFILTSKGTTEGSLFPS